MSYYPPESMSPHEFVSTSTPGLTTLRYGNNLDFLKERVMQVPSVGRIVHYQAYGTPGGEFKSQPRAAIIAELHDDQECTVVVLNPQGLFFNRVKHAPGDEPTPGCWNWPPRSS